LETKYAKQNTDAQSELEAIESAHLEVLRKYAADKMATTATIKYTNDMLIEQRKKLAAASIKHASFNAPAAEEDKDDKHDEVGAAEYVVDLTNDETIKSIVDAAVAAAVSAALASQQQAYQQEYITAQAADRQSLNDLHKELVTAMAAYGSGTATPEQAGRVAELQAQIAAPPTSMPTPTHPPAPTVNSVKMHKGGGGKGSGSQVVGNSVRTKTKTSREPASRLPKESLEKSDLRRRTPRTMTSSRVRRQGSTRLDIDTAIPHGQSGESSIAPCRKPAGTSCSISLCSFSFCSSVTSFSSQSLHSSVTSSSLTSASPCSCPSSTTPLLTQRVSKPAGSSSSKSLWCLSQTCSTSV
jgi:hypothetical protein